MGKRRSDGEGSVYKDSQGRGWWAQLPKGPDGKRPRRLAPTEKAAVALLRQMRAEREAGRDLTKRASTVEELAAVWLETVSAHARPSTRSAYRTQIGHATGRIGNVKADAVTLELVQRLANQLAASGLGPRMVRVVLSKLKAVLQLAVDWGTLGRNPVELRKLRLAPLREKEPEPLSDDEARLLLAAADDVEARGADFRLAPAWWLATLLGLRRGEICALRWSDWDERAGTLRIARQYAPAEGGGYELREPKSAAGVRLLPVGPALAERLRRHRVLLAAERLRLGGIWKNNDLILCDERGEPIAPGILNDALTRLCKAAELRQFNPHLLRHSLATLVSEAGYSEAVIGSILGHGKQGSVTKRYTHARPTAVRAALLAVEALILGDDGPDPATGKPTKEAI